MEVKIVESWKGTPIRKKFAVSLTMIINYKHIATHLLKQNANTDKHSMADGSIKAIMS